MSVVLVDDDSFATAGTVVVAGVHAAGAPGPRLCDDADGERLDRPVRQG
jgi:hypothetical protein